MSTQQVQSETEEKIQHVNHNKGRINHQWSSNFHLKRTTPKYILNTYR